VRPPAERTSIPLNMRYCSGVEQWPVVAQSGATTLADVVARSLRLGDAAPPSSSSRG
jgi:hypothetical protein